MKDPAFKDATGNFSPGLFAQALQSISMTEQGYLNSMREHNLRRQILTTVGKVVNSPEMLIDALNSFNGETRTLRYVLVPASVAGTISDPTRRGSQALLRKSSDASSPNPNSAKSAFSPSRPTRSKTRSTITEADLKAAYEANKDKLGNPEKRHIQQIPFPDLAAANAAYQKIQSGTDFVALAKDKSLSESRHRPRHASHAPTSPIPRSPTPRSNSR